MGKFVISQAKNGVKFNLKAANGEVIASSQVYKDEKLLPALSIMLLLLR